MGKAAASTQSCGVRDVQPRGGELGTAPTVSTVQTFAYPCPPQRHGEGGVLWTLSGDVGTNEPLAHDKVTLAFLPIP